MDDISPDDLRQLYQDSVVLYKNKLVYVENVGRTKLISIKELATQRTRVVAYDGDSFKPPTRRLGFVNVDSAVIYLTRIPVRRYKVGYSRDNIRCTLAPIDYPKGRAETRVKVSSLSIPEIADAFYNRYPTFTEAKEMAREFNGTYAFDKQFAVTGDGIIIYKHTSVGRISKDTADVYGIRFNKEYTHLINLLDNNYEKTTQPSKT